MGRTLQPEDVLAHYRIIGPLGAGGMGEVYRARDTKLDRDVAIKVLPADLVRSEDRLRRFILEAKSASSLNHPHIVTIYEIGQDAVRPAAGSVDAGTAPVHYIAMELVSGRTLKDLIHQEKADLKTLLGHLAQAAEGLSKAHTAGIVHRDLKPGNIMINRDGYAKVLDFGLAKLTEHVKSAGDATSAPTEVADRTEGGAMMGTVGYMSPEQVLGRPVDQRSDIFSFGCILYEAASRQRPFEAETSIDTMHRILHDKPAPLDTVSAATPAELRRLIRRCIEKNPDQRLQSIKDLAIELREIVDEFDTLSATATSGSVVGQAAVPPRRRMGLTAVVAGSLLVAAVLALGGLWLRSLLGRDASRPTPFQSMRLSSLMTHTSLVDATLSRDGRYLAYVIGPAGQWTLWVRQVATGSDVQVLQPQGVQIAGIAFSPDGNYLYYLGTDPDNTNYRALFEVPSLGGASRKRFFDVDTAVSFSPDQKKAVFVRGAPQHQACHLVVADLETGQERILATVKEPETIAFVSPAWSPDGTGIAAVVLTAAVRRVPRLEIFDAGDGARRALDMPPATAVNGIGWLPGGSALAMTAQVQPVASSQVWLVPYPAGRARRITNDLDDYGGLSVSAEGAIEVSRFTSSRSIWKVASDEPGTESQIFGTIDGWTGDLSQAADGSLLFTAMKDIGRSIWSLTPDGSRSRTFIPSPGLIPTQKLVAGGRETVFTHYGQDGVGHVWRADADGGNLRRLTDGPGEQQVAVSLDGRTVLFIKADTSRVLWRMSGDGGQPEKLLERFSGFADLSPDGKRLVYTEIVELGGRIRDQYTVIPIEGGGPKASFIPEGDYFFVGWTPDGGALTYIRTLDGVGNVWKQPAGGGPPEQITHFTEGRLTTREHSRDGSRIALGRRIGQIENVWTVAADGTGAVQLTGFKSGRVFAPFAWSRDGRSLFFAHGEPRQEVVLIRDQGPEVE